jgi:hypothetical protein
MRKKEDFSRALLTKTTLSEAVKCQRYWAVILSCPFCKSDERTGWADTKRSMEATKSRVSAMRPEMACARQFAACAKVSSKLSPLVKLRADPESERESPYRVPLGMKLAALAGGNIKGPSSECQAASTYRPADQT